MKVIIYEFMKYSYPCLIACTKILQGIATGAESRGRDESNVDEGTKSGLVVSDRSLLPILVQTSLQGAML